MGWIILFSFGKDEKQCQMLRRSKKIGSKNIYVKKVLTFMRPKMVIGLVY